ncbi:MAG: glycosyltransferase family 4 protein [Patescibacteria group bacterium]
MKNIFLIFHGRFPSEKAASLFTAKSCESFAKQGIIVTLLVPRRRQREMVNPYSYYHVRENFSIVYLPTLDLLGLHFFQKTAFQISFVIFSLSSFFFLLFKASKQDIIYSNESLPILLCSFYFPRTFYETHDFPEQKLFFYKMLFRQVRQLLVTNMWKVNQIEQIFGLFRDKILCEYNAVDIEEFDIPITKEEARNKLKLPLDKKIALYTGHLYGWKGVSTLADAAANFPPEYLAVFVGGTSKDIENFKEKYSHNPQVLIAGHKKHDEIPIWQKAADVLVLPNTAREKISKYYTSPMKLFEYAASQRPIVASSIPSIMELFDDRAVFFVSPDNPLELAKAIEKACNNERLSRSKSACAYNWVRKHTWERRATRIISFMGV